MFLQALELHIVTRFTMLKFPHHKILFFTKLHVTVDSITTNRENLEKSYLRPLG